MAPTADQLEDYQAEVISLRTMAKSIDDALDCAESCETMEDFIANLEEARTLTAELQKMLKEVM